MKKTVFLIWMYILLLNPKKTIVFLILGGNGCGKMLTIQLTMEYKFRIIFI